MSAPMTSSERPMLNRQSPTNAYASCVVGLAARLVHGEEVGEHLRGVPLGGEPVVDGHAGVLGERLDVGLRRLPRYSIASYMRPSTRAVSAIDSLCPSCEPDGSR